MIFHLLYLTDSVLSLQREYTMQIISNFIRGGLSVVKVTMVSMIYRYPYRTSAEGLHSDWMSIGKDIDSVIGRLESAARNE